MPRECRDEVDQASALRLVSYRQFSEVLVRENMHLKRVLRKSSVAWSEVSRQHMIQSGNIGSTVSPARLPMEILLRILEFAMTSPHPIVDPLSPLFGESIQPRSWKAEPDCDPLSCDMPRHARGRHGIPVATE